MRDFARLREQLRLALLCGAIGAPLAACGATAAPAPVDEPISNHDDTATDPPPADVPWPVPVGSCGANGAFCAPVGQVAAAAAQPVERGCPESFNHGELYYSLDRADTAAHAGQGEACCYDYNDGCMKGRPLLDGGLLSVAPVRAGGGWARRGAAPDVAALPSALRAALAAGWLEDALLEHASIASFARATLELMALGAPPALLADTQRAALDEVRHAELCFGLVERYLGRRVAPGPLAAATPRPAELTRFAVDTFVEGCVAETVATLAATRALAGCRDQEVARVLARIVRDETRHAALAWRTVAWALARGGAPVAAALRAQAAAMMPAADATWLGDDHDAALRAHGRVDGATQRGAWLDAWREIIAPTLAELLSAAPAVATPEPELIEGVLHA